MTKPLVDPAERLRDLSIAEQVLWSRGLTVGGVDEVGAGPLAGPVVAACVVLNPSHWQELRGVDDSKALKPQQREELDRLIRAHALAVSVSRGTVQEIDRMNIREAAILAMRRCVEAIAADSACPDHLLVDARAIPGTAIPQTGLVAGDRRSLSIAAASIVAKVARDREMASADLVFPEYGFAQHKGYGTKAHLYALAAHGPCPLHRRSFAPIARLLRGDEHG